MDKNRIIHHTEQYFISFVQIKKSDNLDINCFFELNEKMFKKDLLSKNIDFYDDEFATGLSYAFSKIIGQISTDPFPEIRKGIGIYDESKTKQSKTVEECIKSAFLDLTNKIQILIEIKNFENDSKVPFEEKEEKSNPILNTTEDTYKAFFDMSSSKLNLNDIVATQIDLIRKAIHQMNHLKVQIIIILIIILKI